MGFANIILGVGVGGAGRCLVVVMVLIFVHVLFICMRADHISLTNLSGKLNSKQGSRNLRGVNTRVGGLDGAAVQRCKDMSLGLVWVMCKRSRPYKQEVQATKVQ